MLLKYKINDKHKKCVICGQNHELLFKINDNGDAICNICLSDNRLLSLLLLNVLSLNKHNNDITNNKIDKLNIELKSLYSEIKDLTEHIDSVIEKLEKLINKNEQVIQRLE